MEILLVLFLLVMAGTILVLLVIVANERKRADTAEEKALIKASQYLKHMEKQLRADAIKKSTAVVKGKVAEQLVPFREDFGYNPRNVRFLGSPVDFIVFAGLTEGDLDRVVFIEVKTGKTGALSRRERQVRDIVDAGEVYYQKVHLKGGSK